MKVVHLNTYDGNGGAGRAVLRLNKGLRELGVQSEIVCLYQFNAASGVQAISDSFLGKLRAVFNIFAERYLVKWYLKSSSIPFSLQRFRLSVRHIKAIKEADVLHIHWINHGFLSPKDLSNLASLNKKIVWTLHDSNPITGGCHVRYGCLNYHRQCGDCPVLANSGPNDLSHRTWLRKHKAYENLAFDFIAPSSWMGDRAAEASLARGKRVHVIANALETDVFKPVDKAVCRKEFNIDPDAIVILAGYMPSKFDRHKGLPELIETLKMLPHQPGVDQSKLLFLFYGSDGNGVEFDIPVAHRFLGKISSDETLSKLYSLSDVFVLSSLEESMGYTALESIACGTPVAAFNTSGVTDIVKHHQTGYLAELKDAASLARGIAWIINEGQSSSLRESARQWASDNFNLRVIATQHIALYKEILSR